MCMFCVPDRSQLNASWAHLTDDECLLRKFDMNQKYGPCQGITRRARWLRAQKFGENPPQYIWDLLQKMPTGGKRVEGEYSLWENPTARALENRA